MTQEEVKDLVGYFVVFALVFGAVTIPVLLWQIGTSLEAIRRAQTLRANIFAQEHPYVIEHHKAVMERHVSWQKREREREEREKEFTEHVEGKEL